MVSTMSNFFTFNETRVFVVEYFGSVFSPALQSLYLWLLDWTINIARYHGSWIVEVATVFDVITSSTSYRLCQDFIPCVPLPLLVELFQTILQLPFIFLDPLTLAYCLQSRSRRKVHCIWWPFGYTLSVLRISLLLSMLCYALVVLPSSTHTVSNVLHYFKITVFHLHNKSNNNNKIKMIIILSSSWLACCGRAVCSIRVCNKWK